MERECNASQLLPRVAMGTWWVWRRVSEKGLAKNHHHVCEERPPEECLNLSVGITQWGKWSRQRTESSSRIQKGMVWLSPAWAIHSHAGCRGRKGGLKKQTNVWEWDSCRKKSLLPENSSPASLAHAPKEYDTKRFGLHSKPAKSMGITFWISLHFGLLCVLDRVLSKQAVNRNIGFLPPCGQDFQHTSTFRIVAEFSKMSSLGREKWSQVTEIPRLSSGGSSAETDRLTASSHFTWWSRAMNRQAGSQHCGSPA